MKAKEYYEKFKGLAEAEDTEAGEICWSILMAFSDDMLEVCKVRNVKRNEAVVGVIKEQNQKWNAMIHIFEKKHGECMLAPNGFLHFWMKKLELKETEIELGFGLNLVLPKEEELV